jgi:hypothetical protein
MNKIVRELVLIAREMVADTVFDMSTVDGWKEYISRELGKIAPVVHVDKSTLGGEARVSLLILVSLDEKKDWSDGILENSTYFRMHLGNDGVLEHFSGYTHHINFRKSRVKSPIDVVAKIGRYIEQVKMGVGR